MADDDITVGSVGVKIVPDASGWDREAERQLSPQAEKLGEQIGQIVGQQIQRSIQDSLRDGVRNAPTEAPAREQGTRTGKTFGASLKASLKAALADMPKVKIDADSSSADLALSNLQIRMEALSNKEIGVDIDADTARAEIDDIKAQLTALGQSHPDISVQVDADRAVADLERFTAQVDKVAAKNARIEVEAQTQQAIDALAAVGIEAEAVDAEHPTVRVDGDVMAAREALQSVGLDARAVAAESPEIRVQADVDQAIAALASVGIEAEAVGGESPTIRVDVDAGSAIAQLAAVGIEAEVVAHLSPSVKVDADTGGAQAGLAGVGNEAVSAAGNIALLSGAFSVLAGLAVAAGAAIVGAMAAAGAALAGIGAALGVAVLALAPVIQAYQALHSAKSSGGGGGSGSSEAASAQARANAIQNANAQVESSERSLANTRANVADQARSAAERVQTAKESEKEAEQSAAQSIAAAEEAVTQARQQAARQVQAAKDAVVAAVQQEKSAEQSLVDARQSAADANANAVAAAATAERNLKSAQDAAKTTQEGLTKARQEAAKQLEDLQNKADDAALAQKQAQLQVEDAKANLARVMNDPGASAAEREQAKLALQEAQQSLKEQAQAAKEAADQNAKAKKAGVDGSDVVKKAKKAEQDANQKVIDQQKALLTAQENVTKTQVRGAQQVAQAQDRVAQAQKAIVDAQAKVTQAQSDGARKVADAEAKVAQARVEGANRVKAAQRSVADAERTQQSQARQGAFQIAQAQAGVANAQRSLQQAYQQSGSAGSASANKVADAMAKLTPAGRSFLDFIMSWKNGFQELSNIAQDTFLPGLEKGLKAMAPLWAPVKRAVAGVGTAMGDLSAKAGEFLGGPAGQKFANFLADNLGPWLTKVGDMFGGFAKGMMGIFEALGPTATNFLGYFGKMWDSFGNWGQNASKDKGFQGFLDYVNRVGPKVFDLLGKMAVVFGKLLAGLAPLGEVTVDGLLALFDGLSKLNPTQLLLIAGGIAAIIFALTGGTAAAVIAVVAGIALAVNWFKKLYDSSADLRKNINTLGSNMSKGFSSAWKIVGPIFSEMFTAINDNLIVAVKGLFALLAHVPSGVWKAAFLILIAPFALVAKGITLQMKGMQALIKVFGSASKWIGSTFKTAWSYVNAYIVDPIKRAYTTVQGLLGVKGMRGIFGAFGDWAKRTWSKAWDGITYVVTHPVDAAESAVSKILGATGLRSTFNAVKDWVKGSWSRAWGGIGYVITHPVDAAKSALLNIFGKDDHSGVRGIFSDVVDAIGRIFGKIDGKVKAPINKVIDILNWFRNQFNQIGAMVGFKLPKLQNLAGGGSVGHGSGHQAPLPRYAGGGTTVQGPWRGSSADNVLGVSYAGVPTAWVNPNEEIIREPAAQAMRKRNPGALEYINAHGDLPNFAGGGSIAPLIKTVQYALAQVGKPYVWGAAGPDAFDCSGLTQQAWSHGAGVHLTHLAQAQHHEGIVSPSRSNLFPGDLVFPTVDPGGHIPHVQMYIGNGQIVEAMNPKMGIRGPKPMTGFAGGAQRPALFATANASNEGGIMSALGDALAAAAKKGGSFISSVGGAIFNPIKGWMADHLGPLKEFKGSLASTVLPGLAKGLASHAISTGIQKAKDQASMFDFGGGDGGSGSGGGSVARWAETINQALSMNHLPVTAAYRNAWLRQVQTESGGNPLAVQHGYTDVNTLSGNLARGLLQVIPPTFRQYMFPGHSNILDGLDNALAAMNYAKHRYPGSEMLQVIGHGHGYAGGTTNATAGLHPVAEDGAELVLSPQLRRFRGGEQVLNARDTKDALIARSGGTNFTVNQYGTQGATPKELATEMLFEYRRTQNGKYGVYA